MYVYMDEYFKFNSNFFSPFYCNFFLLLLCSPHNNLSLHSLQVFTLIDKKMYFLLHRLLLRCDLMINSIFFFWLALSDHITNDETFYSKNVAQKNLNLNFQWIKFAHVDHNLLNSCFLGCEFTSKQHFFNNARKIDFPSTFLNLITLSL